MTTDEARAANVDTARRVVQVVAILPTAQRLVHLSGCRVGGQDPNSAPWSPERIETDDKRLGAYEASKVETTPSSKRPPRHSSPPDHRQPLHRYRPRENRRNRPTDRPRRDRDRSHPRSSPCFDLRSFYVRSRRHRRLPRPVHGAASNASPDERTVGLGSRRRHATTARPPAPPRRPSRHQESAPADINRAPETAPSVAHPRRSGNAQLPLIRPLSHRTGQRARDRARSPPQRHLQGSPTVERTPHRKPPMTNRLHGGAWGRRLSRPSSAGSGRDSGWRSRRQRGRLATPVEPGGTTRSTLTRHSKPTNSKSGVTNA